MTITRRRITFSLDGAALAINVYPTDQEWPAMEAIFRAAADGVRDSGGDVEIVAFNEERTAL